jgi:hypothetical protein
MELIIHFRETESYQFDVLPLSGRDVREAIAKKENIPCDLFYLTLDGSILTDQGLVSSTSSRVIRASMKLLGGKGGFGSMLKSLAKKSGGKRTTDFGACRDLSGRRLRHVNDELILQKWKVSLVSLSLTLWCLSVSLTLGWPHLISDDRKRKIKVKNLIQRVRPTQELICGFSMHQVGLKE